MNHRRTGNKAAVASNLLGLARIHRQQGDLPAALESAKEALDIAREINARNRIQVQQLLLSEIYTDLGRHKEALDMFKRHTETRSEIFNEENSRAVAEIQARFEAGQKEKEIELLEQRQAVSALELERQRATRRALVLGFGLLSLIALLLFNPYRLKSREALVLETARQERQVNARLREIDRLTDRVIGFREGANDYLQKPISKDELLARVGIHLALLDMHRSQKEEVKVLRGLLPICAGCKRIRDDQGYWNEIETYIGVHSEAEFSHGMCLDCAEEIYGDLRSEQARIGG